MSTAPARVQVEKVFGLSNLQQGILFHCIEDAERQIYLTQLCLDIEADLDLARLEASWNAVIARHDALRCSLVWKKVKAPIQAVQARAPLAVAHHDLQALTLAEQPGWIERWLAEDRLRPISLQKPPLMRVAVLQTRPRMHGLVWTHHHILLDGWSVAQVLSEVFAAYRAGGSAATLAPAVLGYDSYLRHIDFSRDRPRAMRFWSDSLRGYRPRPTARPDVPGAGAVPLSDRELKLHVDSQATAQLTAFARSCRVTLGTCLIAAWALTVCLLSGMRDIVLGVVQSGRPSGLAGVEALVGLCACTLPLRVRIPAGRTVGAWLEDVQRAMLDVEEHQHTPLVDVRAAAGLAGDVQLFDTIIAVENFPVQAALAGLPEGWRLQAWRGFQTSNYAFGLIAMPMDELELLVPYSAEHFSPAAVQAMLGTLRRVLSELPRAAESEVQALAAVCGHVTQSPSAAAPPTAADENALEQALRGHARAHPSLAALTDEQGSLSWEALLDRTADFTAARAPAVAWNVQEVLPLIAALRAGHAAAAGPAAPPWSGPGWTPPPLRIDAQGPCRPGPWMGWGATQLEFAPGETVVIASSAPTTLALAVLLMAFAAGLHVVLIEEASQATPAAILALAHRYGAAWLYGDSLDARAIRGAAEEKARPDTPRLLLPGAWPLLGQDLPLPASIDTCAWLYVDRGGNLALIERVRRLEGALHRDQACAPGRTLRVQDRDGREAHALVVGRLTLA